MRGGVDGYWGGSIGDTQKRRRADSYVEPHRDSSSERLVASCAQAPSAAQAGLHAKRQVIAIEVDHVEVAHAIIVILRRLDHFCSAFDKFRVNRVDILHEHADSAVAR